MMEILRAPHVWIAAALYGGFWIAEVFLPTAWLFDIVNCLVISVGAGTIVSYGPGLWSSLGKRQLSAGHILVMGIGVTWIANIIRHFWNWGWRWLGQPDWMINHPFVAFQIYVIFTGGLLHLLAKDAIEGHIPRENYLRLGKWVTLGVVMSLIIISGLEPSPFHDNRPNDAGVCPPIESSR